MKTALEVGEEMLACEGQPMSREIAEEMACLLFFEKDSEPLDAEKLKDEAIYKIAKARTELAGVPINDYALLMINTISAGRPGTAIMYVAALKAISKRNGGDQVTVSMICNKNGFAMGFPSEDDLRRIWGGQKDKGSPLGNSLDNPEAWK